MNYIDFHIHIDFYDNPEYIMKQYEYNQIYCLFVTSLPELFAKHFNKVKNYKYIRLALGFHPEMVTHYSFKKDVFKKCLNYTNYIGEVGIDASIKQEKYIEEQYRIFDFITQNRYTRGKILSIHSKGSEAEILKILLKNEVKSAVFHWYSGTLTDMRAIAKAGYYFSVNPNMLKSKKGIKLLHKLPKNRILFETDGPFCRFAKKIITPDFIPLAYEEFSNELGIDFKKVVFNNFKRLLIQAQLQRNGKY